MDKEGIKNSAGEIAHEFKLTGECVTNISKKKKTFTYFAYSKDRGGNEAAVKRFGIETFMTRANEAIKTNARNNAARESKTDPEIKAYQDRMRAAAEKLPAEARSAFIEKMDKVLQDALEEQEKLVAELDK